MRRSVENMKDTIFFYFRLFVTLELSLITQKAAINDLKSEKLKLKIFEYNEVLLRSKDFREE